MSNKKYQVTKFIESELHREAKDREHASHLDPKFEKKIYELGTEWALNNHDVNDTIELAKSINYKGNLSENKSFLNGYARGLRLIMIEQMSKTQPAKR